MAARPPSVTEIPIFINATSSNGPLYIEDSFIVPVNGDNEFVPRFWAFNRVQSLLDRMKYNGTDNDTIDEIINISIDFHFATEYTSLFVELPDDLKDRMLGGGTVPLGTGSADFPTCFRLIHAAGFRGSFILQTARQEGLSEVELAIRNRQFVEEHLATVASISG